MKSVCCTSKIYSNFRKFRQGGGATVVVLGKATGMAMVAGTVIAKETAMAMWKAIRKAKGKATVLIK
jgi:hypothetical protein